MRNSGIVEQPPVEEQAANAFDHGSAQQLIIKHESGSHFSLKKAAAIGAVCVVGGGTLLSGLAGLPSKIWDDIKGAAPHPELNGQVFNAIEKVSLPDRTTLVEAQGKSSAKIGMEFDWSFPVLGWFWNHTAAKLTTMNASAQRYGDVEINAAQGAITLSPYHTNTHDPNRQWGITATVDPDKLSFGKDMNYVLDSSGQPEVQSNDGLLVRIAGVVGISSDQAKRVANTTTISDTSFEDGCGPALILDIQTGVMKSVRYYTDSVAGLLPPTPEAQKSARLLKGMEQEPIHVVFQRQRVNHHGQVTTDNISPVEVTVPQQYVQTRQTIASTFHLSPNSVQFDTGCYFTGPAITDQEQILAQAASTTSTGALAKG
jgi:hypothetical protein